MLYNIFIIARIINCIFANECDKDAIEECNLLLRGEGGSRGHRELTDQLLR